MANYHNIGARQKRKGEVRACPLLLLQKEAVRRCSTSAHE